MSEKTQGKYPSQFDKVKEITDRLEAGVLELMNSESYKTFLKTMAHFHAYSLNNTILIALQRPDSTYVAGYAAWKKNFGRQVLKGEQGIRILAPTPYKKKMEVDVIDPATGQARLNPDGTKATEMKEIMVPAFKVVSVFDVSQTDGRPLPSLGVNELTGDVRQYEMFFEALKRSCPVPIAFEQIDSGAKGYYHTVDHRIALQEGMSQVQTIKTLIHEMTHEHLHSKDPKELPPEEPRLTRNAKEVEAEAVAYTVAQHYGIETSDYSFAYIAGWSAGKETPELKASLDRIRIAADEMITAIDGHLQELQQEHSQEHLTAEDQAIDQKGAAIAAVTGPFRYYSTQRPVDIGTFPKPPDNPVVEIVNYDRRIPVENKPFRAWGYIEYQKPLTDQQADDYELRPASMQVPEKKSVLQDLQGKKKPREPKAKEPAAPRRTRKQKEEAR